MKTNIFLKLFTLAFIFMVSVFPVFAEDDIENVLSNVVIEQTDLDTYSVNLFFNEKFKGKAFVQNQKQGNYLVMIPDTMTNENGVKVVYKDKKDKKNLKLNVEEKPVIKDNEESSYVKISLNLAPTYRLKLTSNVMIKEQQKSAKSLISIFSICFVILLAIAGFVASKIIKLLQTTIDTKSYTSFPVGYLQSVEKKSEIKNNAENPINNTREDREDREQEENQQEENTFSCFDIPTEKVDDNEKIAFKSTLKQTSNLLKERTTKSKQTNPLEKSFEEDSSECLIPFAQDYQQEINTKKEEPVKIEPELLSELHITPTRGFYLTTNDDAFALFGYTGDKVFLLKKFDDLTQINLQARFYEKDGNVDLYIVRLDSYKAMIAISDAGMRELAVL
jgi:hypothetical protein